MNAFNEDTAFILNGIFRKKKHKFTLYVSNSLSCSITRDTDPVSFDNVNIQRLHKNMKEYSAS